MARTYRFFIRNSDTELRLGKPYISFSENCEPEVFSQLVRVLRAGPGDRIVLLSYKEADFAEQNSDPFFEYEYEVVSAHKKEVLLNFKGKKENENELDFSLGLVLCLPNRPDKLELVLQKAVELGVSEIVLVSADYSQLKHKLREDRLQKIVIEAAEQSERAVVPEINLHGKLSGYLEGLDSPEVSQVIVAMEREGEAGSTNEASGTNKVGTEPGSPMEIIGRKKEAGAIQFLVGPEGGFSEDEKKIIEKLNLITFTLGRRILRTETAAIVSLGIASMA